MILWMAILQSFLPPVSSIKSVTVYPTEFEEKRIAEEKRFGPQGIWIESDKPGDETNVSTRDTGGGMSSGSEQSDDEFDRKDEEDDGTGYDQEKLRRYERDTMRYYFAWCPSAVACQANFGFYEAFSEKADVFKVPLALLRPPRRSQRHQIIQTCPEIRKIRHHWWRPGKRRWQRF
eukprot:45253_1